MPAFSGQLFEAWQYAAWFYNGFRSEAD